MTSNNKKPDREFSGEKKLLYRLPALTGLSGGLFACSLAGFNPATLLGTALLTLAGAYAGWRLRKQHQTNLQDRFEQWTALYAYSNELESLFLQVAPILLRQVQTSRRHTEQEITALTGQFAAMAARLEDIAAGVSKLVATADFAGNSNEAGMLRSNVDQIQNEICAMLVAFQFQDRVSQMLAHVENNLACLHDTVQTASRQGNARHAGMIDIALTLQQMQLHYSLPEQHINHQTNAPAEHLPASGDELTFF